MTSSNERFYDEEIAPALAELAKRCSDKGMSFVASVEYAPGDSGSTVSLTEDHGNGIHMTAFASRCNSNVDALFMSIIRRAKATGHSSIFLMQLGVPPVPSSEIDKLEAHLKSLVIAHPEKALLAALDDDTRMWFVAELTSVASARVSLTEIEALVSQHLTPAKGGAA